MKSDLDLGLEIVMPYFARKETVATARYTWNNAGRGKDPFVILQWTHSGEGVFELAGRRQRVPAGHAFVALIPEASRYYFPPEARDPWTFSWVNFYGSFACELFRRLRGAFGPVIALSSRGAAAAALRRLLVRDGSDRFRRSLESYAFVLEWWREASQPAGRAEDRVERALRFGREHFREPLGVKQLAAEAGMSREHFSRVFLQRTGETPAASLRRLRLDEAAVLMRETDLPLGEIAMRSGFYSGRHLMRAFQRERRRTPSQFRRR